MRITTVLLTCAVANIVTEQSSYAQGILQDLGGRISKEFKKIPNEIPKRVNQAKDDLLKDRDKIVNEANEAMNRIRMDFDRERTNALAQLRVMRPGEVNNIVQNTIIEQANEYLIKQGASVNPQNGEMDLSQTPLGNNMRKWAEGFAQGNERSGGLDRFIYNVRARTMVVNLWSRHRHSWGRSIFPGQGPAILYDVTQRAQVIMDFNKKSINFDIDAGPLAPRVSSAAFQSLSDGDIIAAAESMSPGIAGQLMQREVMNEYDAKVNEYAQRHGSENVYFASRNFVDWATPETIGRYVANGIVTAGASVYPQIMAAARDRAQSEMPRLTQWLQSRGMDQAEAVASDLLTGQTPRWPNIRFDMIPVKYGSREKPLNIGYTPWRYVDHLAFVIVWSPQRAQEYREQNVSTTSFSRKMQNTTNEILFASNLGVSYQLVRMQNGTLGARVEKQPQDGVPATRIQVSGTSGYTYLEPGDIILNLDGMPFQSPNDVLGHRQQTTIRFQDGRSNQTMDGVLFIP